MLAVIEARIMYLCQSVLKQMFLGNAEAVPHKCSSREIISSIPVTNVKGNNFINNGKISWIYFYLISARFDQNLNSPRCRT